MITSEEARKISKSAKFVPPVYLTMEETERLIREAASKGMFSTYTDTRLGMGVGKKLCDLGYMVHYNAFTFSTHISWSVAL